MKTPEVAAFFDNATNTISYVVSVRSSKDCAVSDPVPGYNPASARISLLIPSVQVNMGGSELPAAQEHGKRFTEVSLNEL